MRLLSIGETAAALGVAVGTLRRWHRQGRMLPFGRTIGAHRRYQRDTVRAALGGERAAIGKIVCYARVSSHDQAEQLKTQAAWLKRHCIEAGFVDIEVISDLGSGLNYRKKGLQRLLQEILRGRVARLALVTKDRLLRFGSELLFRVCEFFHVEVIVLNAVPDVELIRIDPAFTSTNGAVK